MSSGELDNGDRYTVNMNGVDSRYMGIELDFVYKPVRWFELSGMFAWADNTWQNAPIGYYYNQNGQALASISGSNSGATTTPYAEDHLWARIDQKGIKVGGSAQTTGALGVSFKPFTGFRIGGDWTMNMRNYSDFSYSNSSSLSALSPGKTLTISEPWRIPWGQQLDLHASYNFPVCKDVRATFSANINNVFNNNYIMDAYTDYSTVGTWENAYRIFYSYGRTFSFRVKIHF
jgi:outer membrane receptor protein involved in Fe transport